MPVRARSRCKQVLACVLLAACGAPADPAADRAEDSAWDTGASGLSAARYTLAWDASALELQPDGGWITTSDLGYRVTVLDGALTTWSASLLVCASFGGTARVADHSSTDVAGTTVGPASEALGALGTTTLDARFDPSAACGVTWVMGPQDLDGAQTLWLEGTYSLDGGAEQPLSVQTTLAWSRQIPWTEADLSGALSATLTRDPSHLFDGVDLDTASGSAAWVQLLANLGQHTTLDVSATEAQP